ncbi:MAG: hypothetical protein JNM07_00150 [Phycisphaerae bacterium]|nr:hypothetical protein [Phycisphaerae bacterium]
MTASTLLASALVSLTAGSAATPPHPPLVARSLALITSVQPDETEEVRVYDCRDFEMFLPPVPEVNVTEQMLARLANASGVSVEPISGAIVSVVATPAGHTAFARLLADVRKLHDVFQVELIVFRMPKGEAPALGAPAAPQNVVVRTSQTVQRMRAASIESVTQRTYLSGWQPVVGQQASGYESRTEKIEEGFRTIVFIGAGPESAERSRVSLRGRVSGVHFQDVQAPLVDRKGGELLVQLPSVVSRTFDTDMSLPFGKATVVAVLDAENEEESLVVACAVKRMQP